ncbi:Poly(A)+ RNA export protein rae1, partial [Datura stramonium]|nr:Poly(A)+ RNA export protein rae1 [Datura stramonium]
NPGNLSFRFESPKLSQATAYVYIWRHCCCKHNCNKSTEVSTPPADSGIKPLLQSKANLLVATSWDNQVRCWEVMGSEPTLERLYPRPLYRMNTRFYAQLGRMMGQLSSLEVVTSK